MYRAESVLCLCLSIRAVKVSNRRRLQQFFDQVEAEISAVPVLPRCVGELGTARLLR